MENESKKRLGELIRRARHEADLKQVELAERLGVTQGVISNVETGVSTIDVPDLQKWANALNKPIMYFHSDEVDNLLEQAASALNDIAPEHRAFAVKVLKSLAKTLNEPDAPVS